MGMRDDVSDSGEDWDELEEPRGSSLFVMLGTTYGVSISLHVVAILCLTLVIFFAPRKEKKAFFIAKREVKPQSYDEKLERDLIKTPKVSAEVPVEKPIIQTEEEVEIAKEVPQGTDLSNQSTKNMNSDSVCDAFGTGGGAAGAYGQRWGKGALIAEGGSPGTESAVLAALRWLQRNQSADGRWDADGWTELAQHPDVGHNRGDSRYDVGITGLALLAYLGNGHTHRLGHFRETVNRGLRWLMTQQNPQDGAIGFQEGEEIYNHAIATMALCEAFAVSRDFKLKRFAQAAVDYCIVAQNPGQGWKYGVKPGSNDTSVTGWMVLALKAARTGGLSVPDEAFVGAQSWFKRVTAESGAVGYQRAGGGSSYIPANKGKYDELPCMTAVSAICRMFTGERASDKDIKRASAIMLEALPAWPSPNDTKQVNFYYWYYGTYAMFQIGGQPWKTWNEAMKSALLDKQCKGGPEDGSWHPVGEWCIAGGRVYATALNALTFEIYYRYDRSQKR